MVSRRTIETPSEVCKNFNVKCVTISQSCEATQAIFGPLTQYDLFY